MFPKKMRLCNGGICAPKGFLASGIYSGIKDKGLDLALFYTKSPSKTFVLFSENRIQAAPNIITRDRILKSRSACAILINSGNANCLTGKRGLLDAEETIDSLAKALRIKKEVVICASTGIIGKRLPVEKIKKAIPKLVDSLSTNGGNLAARAIMTTDTAKKEIAVIFKTGSAYVKIGAIAKGAGMISPNLATMLCFITTDANITYDALKSALKEAVGVSFNRITIDGQMSTNDMVTITANGMAGNPVIKTATRDFKIFCSALNFVCERLAKSIVKDAEGATKFIEITVKNAFTKEDASNIARAIANSPLVKTAFYGEDPNFGRILAAAGAASRRVNPERLKLFIQGAPVFKNGAISNFNFDELRRKLKKEDIDVILDLGIGKESFRLWTSDLTEEYVRINSAYST